jgi:long-chain acyl-CoA synthetase
MAHDTIPARFMAQAKTRPDSPAYFAKEGGSYKGTNWGEYVSQVRAAAKSLIHLGLEPGSTVAILGFNRPEWVIFDIAAMCVGAAPAGIYTTCSPTEVQYIIDHCEAPIVLLENEGQWNKVNEERENLPKLKTVVMMQGTSIDDELCTDWDAFMALGADVSDEDLDARVDALDPAALATFIYTSGTTGPPKGVMLSHENLSWTASCAQGITSLTDKDVSMSYLPLSHIAEQMFTIHCPITAGSVVYFAESIEKVPDNLKEVRPTVFFAVPRIWEKFYAAISGKLKDATGFKATMAGWAQETGREVSDLKNQGQEAGGWLKMKHNFFTGKVYNPLKEKIGLDRARVCVSGAAPVAKEILQFFSGFDLNVLEVYGQSEGTGPTSFNVPGKTKFGSVGPALPGVEVKIAADGEICVQGPNVYLGYYKDTAATDEALIDGWLHSGDLGEIDSQGYLHITGRKKDIIITAGGKNIAPKNIEAAMKNHPLVNECVVIGDRRKFLSALVTIDPDAIGKWAADNGQSTENQHENEKLIAEVQTYVDATNSLFARVEHIRKFRILTRQLTIEDGELTPTLKVKRSKVNDHFADTIESMYADA